MEQLSPLAPLQHSAEYNEVEQQLKQLFIALFEQSLRTKFRRIDHYGYPHLLEAEDFETVQRFIKRDGLNLLNRGDDKQAYMLEVFRAWRGQHARRGLGLLKFYLQMLWPNGLMVNQYWHSISQFNDYPLVLTEQQTADSFLTSRVGVLISPDSLSDPTELRQIAPTLQHIVPARMVLTVHIGVLSEPMEMAMAMAGTIIMCASFEDLALV